MILKNSPRLTARYWVAILLASMCGTNLGDYFPDVLKINVITELAILAAVFVVIVVASQAAKRGGEAFYWLTILTVRAAATAIADYSIAGLHLTYIMAGVALAVILSLLVFVARSPTAIPPQGELPATNGVYWLTMLTAGALGAVIGDGLGHAIHPMQVGWPVSAGLATLGLAVTLTVGARLGWRTAASYWCAIVAVRWWGTNVGDILAFVTNLTTSLLVTAAAMTAVLVLWRTSAKGGEERALGQL